MIEVELPEEISLHTPDQFTQEVRLRAAAKLFEAGSISSGRAAALAGMARIEFLAQLDRLGVSALNLSPEQLDQEIASIERLKQHDPTLLPPSAGPD